MIVHTLSGPWAVSSPGGGQGAQDEALRGVDAVGGGNGAVGMLRGAVALWTGYRPMEWGGSTGKAGAGPESPVAGAGGCGKRLGTAPCSAAPVPCRIEGCSQSN
jgi:hypothetical protein